MKKNLLIILLFACGITFAQENSVQSFTDIEIDGIGADIGSQFSETNIKTRPSIETGANNSRMAATSYTSRPDFEADACDLETEDFQGTNFPFGITACDFLPISSAGNCLYPAGEILPGFSFHSTPTAQMVVVNPPNFGLTSTIVGPNFFADNGFIDFDPAVGSVGFDMPFTGFLGQTTVTIIGPSGVIASEVFTPGFVGFIADEEITRLEFSNSTGTGGELIDNLSFGPTCGGGGDGEHCDPSDCLLVTCPPDVTVACIEDYVADAANAIAEFNCSSEPPVIETTTYDIDIANINFSCPNCCGTGNSYGSSPLNLTWTDATVGTIVGATIDFSVGVNCGGTGQFPVSLNGASQGTTSSSNTCSCATTPDPISVTLNPDDINIGGSNTFTLSPTSLIGLWDVFGPTIYAQVTIETSVGGGGVLGTEAFRYVDQPQATGAANCPGTTYEITYHVGDNLGNVGCCVQLVTIDNAPPSVTVTPGETVSCYEDIIAEEDAATITTSCGEIYFLKILPPVLEGEHECPGTTYTYGYRVRDNCGREVVANRVFTIGNNAAPTIISPPDMTIACAWNAEINPDYAEVTTGCTLGYTTTVTGPTTTGSDNCPGATYTYTYTVTDDCGRTASDTRKFTIANTAPVFLNCPSVPLQLNCEDEGWQENIQAWLASIQAESSCSAALNVTNNYNPNSQGLCINNGTKIVRFFATDACGRTSTCEGMIIVADTEPPLFVEAPQDELVVCNYITQDKLDAWVDAHGYAEVEDCWANVNWSTFPNNPTINCGGNPGPTSLTVTFVATDGCGNKASMDATFTALPAMGGIGGSTEDIAEESMQLFQNQPNPFSDETSISFYLPQGGKATLSIYDVSGKLLKEINGEYSEGMNVEAIDRSDLQGAGMLYYKLSTADETATKRMILLD